VRALLVGIFVRQIHVIMFGLGLFRVGCYDKKTINDRAHRVCGWRTPRASRKHT